MRTRRGAAVAPRGVGRVPVVARDVRVDDLDPLGARELREFERAFKVDRVAQGEREDVGRGDAREFFAERRAVAEHEEEFVPTFREALGEVCEVTLAPAERARGADLKNSH